MAGVGGGDTCDRLTFLVRRHSAGITSKNKRLSSRVTVLTSCLAVAFSADISSESKASAAKTSSVFLSHKHREETVNPSNSICLIVFVLEEPLS